MTTSFLIGDSIPDKRIFRGDFIPNKGILVAILSFTEEYIGNFVHDRGRNNDILSLIKDNRT